MTTPDLDIRPYADCDKHQIETLHRRVFGPGRFARTAYRIREGADVTETESTTCSRVGWIGSSVAAAVTMTPVTVGGTSGAMLLGPLVVAPEFAGNGLGQPMVQAALQAAQANGSKIVLLVGDQAYYQRFDSKIIERGHITLPGPVNVDRLLAVELTTGSLATFSGLVERERASSTI